MNKYRKHGKNHTSWRQVQAWMSARESFSNSTKTFRGGPVDKDSVTLGRLPEDLRNKFKEGDVDYVVWSYNTPIAWHINTGWVVPDVSYSTTTKGHQNTVRTAVT